MQSVNPLIRNFLKRLALAIGAFTLATAGLTQIRAASPSTTPTVEQEVTAVDDEYVAAELKRDEAALRRLIDERFVYNSAKGATSGKEEMIQHVLSLGMTGQKITERSVIVEGEVALVFATTELRFANPGKADSVSTLRYTCVYVKRDDQWRMLALQMQPRN